MLYATAFCLQLVGRFLTFPLAGTAVVEAVKVLAFWLSCITTVITVNTSTIYGNVNSVNDDMEALLSMAHNQVIVTAVLVMPEKPEKPEKTVPLRVEVSETFKSRLKAQSGRMGVTMGELLETLADEALQQLELKALEQLKR